MNENVLDYIYFAKEYNLFSRNFLLDVNTQYHRTKKGLMRDISPYRKDLLINVVDTFKQKLNLISQLPVNEYTINLKKILLKTGTIDEDVFKYLKSNYIVNNELL